MSRTAYSLKNIKFVIVFQFLSNLCGFFTRRVFVSTLTQDYLGLDGAFSNILGILSLAELGIGGAITYSLYRPLAQGDRQQVCALMALYRRVYLVVGLVVAAAGCALAPLLPVLIHDLPDIPHIYGIYLLFVANSALSYFFVYKQSLIIADQRQYIVTTCHYTLNILLRLSQAVFLWFTHNYFAYLILQICVTLLENLYLSYRANKIYPYIKTNQPPPLNRKVNDQIVRNTKAMLLHKLGSILVFGTDNLLISAFTGAVQVGLYSNYLMVTNGLNAIFNQMFGALTASVGNLGATEDTAHSLPVFRRINFVNSWLYGFSAVCLMLLLNPFIELWVGSDYLFSQEIVALIAVNFYVGGMRCTARTFRDAYGLYRHFRYAPIAESAINLVVSAALAVPFGVAGILMGTIISTMTVCFWTEPYVLFRFGFQSPVGEFFRGYGVNTLITLLTYGSVVSLCALLPGSGFPLFLGKLAVCILVGNLVFLLAYCGRNEFKFFLGLALSLFKRWKKR